MAVSVSLQASIIQATATWSPTITAPAGGALVVYIAVSRSSGTVATTDLTVSGLGGTWVEIQPDQYSSRRGVRSFISTNASGTGTLTVSYVGAAFQAMHGSVLSVTGVNLTTPIDGLDLVNSGEFGSGTSASPVVTGASAAGDATLSFLTFETNQACAPEAGWVELYDNGEANGIRRVGIAWDADADTTPAWTWTTSSGYTCHAFRLKAAAGGGSHDGAAAVAPVATVTAAAQRTTGGGGSVNPSAGVTASAALRASVGASVPVAVGVTGQGVRAAQAAAAVAAQVAVSAGAVRAAPTGAAVSVGVGVVADASVVAPGGEATVLTVVGTTAVGRLAAAAGAGPAVGVTLTAAADVVRASDALLTAAAAVTVAATVSAPSGAAVVASAAISVDAEVESAGWEPIVDVSVEPGGTRVRHLVEVGGTLYRERVAVAATRMDGAAGDTRVGRAVPAPTREER